MIQVSDTAIACDVRPAINFGDRAEGKSIDYVVLHYTGMENGQGALKWLCMQESGVSCHYLVEEDGRVFQMVREEKRAWHAGKSCWKGETDINSCSIGIEIVNPGHDHGYRDFPDDQIVSVIDLCLDIKQRNRIGTANFLAHSDIAPLRKRDPGELFPWMQFADQGIGIYQTPCAIRSGRFFQQGDQGEPVAALQSMLAILGYCVEITGEYCNQTSGVVAAFQRRFRPAQVDGIADVSTIESLNQILRTVAPNT